MKFLHVLHGYPPNVGGIQTLFQQLSERLVNEYGDEVTVFTSNAYSNYHFWQEDDRTMPAGTEIINGVTVRRFPVFNRFSWLRLNMARLAYKFKLPYHDWLRTIYNGPIIPGMTQAIADAEADVIIASAFPLLHMMYAARGAKKRRTPLLFFGALHPVDSWGFDRQMIFEAIHQADGYLAITTFERDFLLGKGIDAEKITVVGAGVDVHKLAQVNGRLWRKQHNLNNKPLIAFIGQQVEHKGIDILIQAMPQVWQAKPEAQLFIVGKPTHYSKTIHQRIATLPAAQQAQITVLDLPTDEEKNGLLAACDLLALPSRHESFGIVLAEAWACGKPVIGGQVGGVAALVDDGMDGFLVPVGDTAALAQAITTLLQNDDLRLQFGAAGRKKVEKQYSWEAITAVYRSACAAALTKP